MLLTMKPFPLLTLLCLLLTACASTSTHQAETPRHQKPPMSLDRMQPQFLYLAAERALHDQQPALAIRFLSALIKKDPAATMPRLELVDLLLASQRKPQLQLAQKLLENMPEQATSLLTPTEHIDFELLYAKVLLANQHNEKAKLLLEGLLPKGPKNLDVRTMLIGLHINNKDYKQAHQLITQGLKVDAQPRLYYMQAQLYRQQKHYKKAERSLVKMQKKYPELEDVVLQRSQLAAQQKQAKKAVRLLQRFIQQHPNTALLSYHHLASLYVRQNQLDLAIQTYQTLLPLTRKPAAIHMAIGKVLYEQAHYQKASQAFAQAVFDLTPQPQTALSETLASAYFYWAASLEANHQWAKAVPHYQQVQAKHDFYLDAQLRLASIDLTQEQFEPAEKRLKHLKVLFSNDLRVDEMLSNLYLASKAYESLLTASEPIVAQHYSANILFNRAVALDNLKRFAQFDVTLDTILKEDPEHHEALNFYAYSLAERNQRLDDAQAMVLKALQFKPKDAYYLDSLAWVYFKQQHYKQAISTQLKALAIVADDPTMLDHLGDMYWLNGNRDKARQTWQKAIQQQHEASARIVLKMQHGLL